MRRDDRDTVCTGRFWTITHLPAGHGAATFPPHFVMTKELLIHLDGQLVPESQAKVSVFDHGLLYGDGVFEICQELGIPIREHDMSRHDIFTADECFLTGTAAEVIAAVKLDQRIIGTGKPGPITQRVIARFRELTQSSGTV